LDYSDHVLGSYLARRLRDRNASALLVIGRDVYTRADLAHVDCFNFLAAATLSAVLNRHLAVKDTRDVFENIAPSSLALPRLGGVAIAVLGACFEIKKLGGDNPLDAWIKRHSERGVVHTFGSIKLREAADAAAKRGRRRSRSRRAPAPRVSGDRISARQGTRPS